MTETPAPQGNEAEFMCWLDRENHRREVVRLKRYLRRLETLQLVSYGMIWFWVAVMFCGFRLRPDLVPASLAGMTTAMVIFGGAFIVWHLIRLKRETTRRLEAEQQAQATIEQGAAPHAPEGAAS